MTLTEYRRKRQFGATLEPEPGKPLPKGKRAIFVVQLHHASRRHYDFRLQVGDALKSWAVPKGPSYDPRVKRMAVEVEDHPVDYAGFEGDIPKGHYGGGHVALFDRGVWATEGDAEAQLAKGHLRFELFGRKLKGRWHLVRSGKAARQPQWLLFKDDDAYAGTLEADDLLADVAPPPAEDARRAGTGKAARKRRSEVAVSGRRRRQDWAKAALQLPRARKGHPPAGAFAPELARLGETPPRGEEWLHELKWDGYRILASVDEGRATLWSRNALEWTGKVPEIRAAVEALGLRSAALDGELIAGKGGREDFTLLQGTLSGEKQGVLTYVLFDLLHVDGVDVSDAPLVERKALLQRILGATPPAHLAYSVHIRGNPDETFAAAEQNGFEGIISKRADRGYHAGRGDDWRKTKRLHSEEYAVVGYTAPKGRRSGFGSLLLARPDADGGWVYAGKVGTGFSEPLLEELAQRIGRAGGPRPTVQVPPHDTDLRTARWFAPRFVVEVFSRGAGNLRGAGHPGLLRQASLKVVRPDKTPEDLRSSDRDPPAEGAGRARRTARAGTTGPADRRRSSNGSNAMPASKRNGPAGKARKAPPRTPPSLSNPDKLVFPDIGVRKRDVAAYYAAMADWLLPEIAGRPLSIIRCPGGIGQPCFFQKHHTPGFELVSSVRLEEESGAEAEYLVVEDAAGLAELVQFNTLEFHPWGSRARDPDVADRVVFDLDPDPSVAWVDVVAAARQVRDLLQALGLVSFVRTSGGKGLHVVVPLRPGCAWSTVKPFTRAFAESLAKSDPLKYVASASKRFRKGKIFIDWLRNGRGATSVASFSLRARPGAPVAMPLRWEELGRVRRSTAFDIRSAPRRMQRLKAHPWAGIDDVRQDLDDVGRRLRKR